MERLQGKLAALQKEQEAEQKNAAWQEHTRIEIFQYGILSLTQPRPVPG